MQLLTRRGLQVNAGAILLCRDFCSYKAGQASTDAAEEFVLICRLAAWTIVMRPLTLAAANRLHPICPQKRTAARLKNC